jgi:hypothetical protein
MLKNFGGKAVCHCADTPLKFGCVRPATRPENAAMVNTWAFRPLHLWRFVRARHTPVGPPVASLARPAPAPHRSDALLTPDRDGGVTCRPSTRGSHPCSIVQAHPACRNAGQCISCGACGCRCVNGISIVGTRLAAEYRGGTRPCQRPAADSLRPRRARVHNGGSVWLTVLHWLCQVRIWRSL